MAAEQTDVKPCCVTGHLHEGQPLGSMATVHGLNCYISKPNHSTATAGEKIDKVVMLSDIFGIYNNAKLVADEWAGQGYEVYVPDLFEGKPVDEELLNTIVPNLRVQEQATTVSKAADTAKTAANLGPFMLTNREAGILSMGKKLILFVSTPLTVVKPKIEAFVQAIRADPKTAHIAAVGFCWGGRYALLLANDSSPARVDCAVANHPSFLTTADVQDIKSTPVAILKGTKDAMMSDNDLEEVEGILYTHLRPSQVLIKKFPDAVHGFTIRGDAADGREKEQKEEANNAAMGFVKQAFGSAVVV